MKRVIVLSLCLLLIASVAMAEKPVTSRYNTGEFKTNPDPSRVYFEGFEGGVVPPAGWTAVVTNASYTWKIASYSPYEGSYYTNCEYDPALVPQDEWLCYEYTLEPGDECLYFSVYASTYWAIDPYQNYNLIVQIDGAEVWNYRDDSVNAVTWEWQQYGIPLDAYNAGDTIELCFGYVGADGAEGAFDAIGVGECPEPPPPPCCPFDHDCYVFDFNESACGASFFDCGMGPNPWAWGVDGLIPAVACDDVPVTNIMGTALGGPYAVSVGGGFSVGPVSVTEYCNCLEVCHYYDTEFGYDGGNVKISMDGGMTWVQVFPSDGYDDILDSTYYIPECVPMEEVFCGDSITFVRDCFDLTEYEGLDVLIGFFFGSESFATDDLGWYIKWAKVGSNNYSPVEHGSWGSIKSLYR